MGDCNAMLLFTIIIAAVELSRVNGYPSGAGEAACTNGMVPNHGPEAQSGNLSSTSFGVFYDNFIGSSVPNDVYYNLSYNYSIQGICGHKKFLEYNA